MKNKGNSRYSAVHVDRIQVRGGDLKTSTDQLCVGTWNIEGLTDEKILLLQVYMEKYGIHLLCLQEVRKPLSEYIITEAGFLLISSGGQNSPEWAGVGFLVHPKLRKSVQNFCQYSNRIAGIKLRVPGGKIAIACAYVPHALRPFTERFDFFQSVQKYWHSISAIGPKKLRTEIWV
jgi:exonuclease III